MIIYFSVTMIMSMLPNFFLTPFFRELILQQVCIENIVESKKKTVNNIYL